MKGWQLLFGVPLCGGLLAFALGGHADVVAALQTPAKPDRVILTREQEAVASRNKILPPGTKSILNVQRRMNYGDYLWNEQGVPKGPVTVRVNLKSQIISVYRQGEEIGTSVILYGANGYDTPAGVFPVLSKDKDHWSSTYDAPMPYTLRLTSDGVSIHGADVKRARATHGCIGVPLEFAQRLFSASHTGDIVEIVEA